MKLFIGCLLFVVAQATQEPPQAVVILNDRGQLLETQAGPYDEGSYLSLFCDAQGGNPFPIVTWWKGGMLIDDTYFRLTEDIVRNELWISELKRGDFMVELTCQASNTNLTSPIKASIRIDLNMKPLYVRITTAPQPLRVGEDITLDCETLGSRPHANIVWWIDNQLIQSKNQSFINDKITYSSIHLSPGIDDNGKVVICEARNPALPHSNMKDKWILNIQFSPEVSLQLGAPLKDFAIKEGDDVYMECVIRANPPVSQLTWFFEGVPFYGNHSAGVIILNQTLVLQNLRKEQRGNYKCLAANAKGQGQSLELLLNVKFAPEVSLQLGAPLKDSTIKEGADVYMECVIRANPPVSELTWFFEGVPFYGNHSAGVIILNQTLVLQNLRKEQRGNYKCLAANTEGQGQSLELLLNLKYTPTCKASQKNLYGVARGEDVNITCEVEANPNEVSFHWALNNSVENVELHNFTSKDTRSVLNFTPRTMLEFGTVLCWGQNVVGVQKEPCVARIIPAGRPDPVRNCVVTNRSHTWLNVECEAGYNGGMPQTFHLDIYKPAVNNHLLLNMTSTDAPVFSINNLPPDTLFVFVMYASNEKGRSKSVELLGNTLPILDQENDRPDPVRNCVVTNLSHTWLNVECEAGYNGGLPERFHLEVYNLGLDHLQINMTSTNASMFSVCNLPPGTTFVFVTYASNKIGNSNSVTLFGNTLPLLDQENETKNLSPQVTILLTALGTFLVMVVIALALFQIRRKQSRKGTLSGEGEDRSEFAGHELPRRADEDPPLSVHYYPPNAVVRG